jgi:hypothetical protein
MYQFLNFDNERGEFNRIEFIKIPIHVGFDIYFHFRGLNLSNMSNTGRENP